LIFQLREHELEWRQIDDEIVVLDGRSSCYLSIEGSGVSLWSSLKAGASREELVEALVDAYGIEPDRAGQDVDRFVADLAGRGLLAA
jgi:hypothetical protein